MTTKKAKKIYVTDIEALEAEEEEDDVEAVD